MSNAPLKALVHDFTAGALQSSLTISDTLACRLASSLLSKRFLIATGLAGSGKTQLVQAFARWLTPTSTHRDPFAPGTAIESDRKTYYVKRSDRLSVEFWNSEEEGQALKVGLPREMIQEWVNYMSANPVNKEKSAREIREAVTPNSRFSAQLHSFESNLKAAALAALTPSTEQTIAKCYEVIPVGADWTGNENILGYPNGLDHSEYCTRPALDLILRAISHPDIPHFLILDEMNLSHVERYFADILSVVESGEKIHLHRDNSRRANGSEIPTELELPKNMFIIGTVNVDETTYMFSPKVLDRANVIEFHVNSTELEIYLNNPAKPDLSKIDGKGHARFGKAFVDAGKEAAAVTPEVKDLYSAEMLQFFKALQGHGAEFGYRVAHESARFVHFYKLLGNFSDDGTWFQNAFDCVVVQKILPKLHGSRAKLGPLLKTLWFLCVTPTAMRGANPANTVLEAARSTDKKTDPSFEIPEGAPYPLSANKIARMWRLLRENGFTSFAEA